MAVLGQRRWFVPEAVQTSAMDCGPAVLKCLLEGFGIPASYGRLREACQTSVDGTSIDTVESLAGQLGLEAEQVMLPLDHMLLPEARAFPAIVVVRLPNGLSHFVLVWRRCGPFLQVMDPAVGRHWVLASRFLREVYIHNQRVPVEAWRSWATSEEFSRLLQRRLAHLGLGSTAGEWLAQAAAAPGWRRLALLDAGIRLVEGLVQVGGLKRGREAAAFLKTLCQQEQNHPPEEGLPIPPECWSVSGVPAQMGEQEQVCLRGAVLVRVRGKSPQGKAGAEARALGPELAAALEVPEARPGQTLFRLLQGGGSFFWLFIALALLAASGVVEAVLLRAAVEMSRDLALFEQRLLAVVSALVLAGGIMLLDLGVAGWLLRLGRGLEIRLRIAFLEKLPRLHDRYLQSRPTSDMAERCQALHQLHHLPRLGGQFLRTALVLFFTAAAIAWFDPGSGPLAAAAAVSALAIPLAFLPLLAGLDLRVRTHAGALHHFCLEALQGLAAVQAHAAERTLQREHDRLLGEWLRASRRLLRWVGGIEAVQLAAGFGLAAGLLFLHAGRSSDMAGALLLGFWALSLPSLGETLALHARQYPLHRNLTLRLLEPLGAPEGPSGANGMMPVSHEGESRPAENKGVDIRLQDVTVQANGHLILDNINLHLKPGSHVAILGASGAGKSSLVGLLLGWHRAESGHVLVDGLPQEGSRLDQLRQETAWVDPAIRLWNQSLAANLAYGCPRNQPPPLGEVVAQAKLGPVVGALAQGLQTVLGDGGKLLSEGEGQRVRLGRAITRPQARLVILDEAFRGLDHQTRRRLLRRARRYWQQATLLCITHDVAHTLEFDRVLVLEAGRLVEDGTPRLLAQKLDSCYRSLLEEEKKVQQGLWSSPVWRRLRLARGRLAQIDSRPTPCTGTLRVRGARHSKCACCPSRNGEA